MATTNDILSTALAQQYAQQNGQQNGGVNPLVSQLVQSLAQPQQTQQQNNGMANMWSDMARKWSSAATSGQSDTNGAAQPKTTQPQTGQTEQTPYQMLLRRVMAAQGGSTSGNDAFVQWLAGLYKSGKGGTDQVSGNQQTNPLMGGGG